MHRLALAATALFALAAPVWAAGDTPVSTKEIGTACMLSDLEACKVITAGFLNRHDYGDNDGEPFLAWQTQSGSTEYDGVIGGFVLLQYKDGWTVLDSGFDGYFDMPRLNDDGVLHQPGYGQGTGVANADRLYQRDPDTGDFIAVDMDQWKDTIGDRLPQGLGIWKGVAYDFSRPWAGYEAVTNLWKDDDANCCPSGGVATIKLEIQDHVLVATDVVLSPPDPSAE